MTRWLLTLLALLMFAATSGSLAAAQGSPDAAPGLSLQRAVERGKAMYLYDRAAWVTSDDLIARLPIERAPEIGGWVVSPTVNGVHVDYFGKDGNADRAVYAADVNGGTVINATIYPIKAEPLLKEPALQMAHALRAAWVEMGHHSGWQPCTNARFNTIVLPPERDGTVPVYFLTPQTQTGSFPFGGHYEVDIAADGGAIYSRAFTRSCIMMTKPPLSGGATPAALFLTHLLDPHPTEVHVFEQYYVGVPVFVGTGPKSVWKVEDGRVDDVSAMMTK
jgi:hypothetical protein